MGQVFGTMIRHTLTLTLALAIEMVSLSLCMIRSTFLAGLMLTPRFTATRLASLFSTGWAAIDVTPKAHDAHPEFAETPGTPKPMNG